MKVPVLIVNLVRPFILFFVISLGLQATAQLTSDEYGRYDSIIVTQNGDTMPNPWAGGLNNSQFSEWNINNDGLMDLFVFDKDHASPRTFINTGKKGKGAYKHAPEYESRFPIMWSWALMVDYNKDGKQDLFTASDIGDIRVFLNTSTGSGATDVKFEQILFKSPYDSTKRVDYITTKFDNGSGGWFYTNVFNLSSDIPGLIDIDYDGDLDIIAYGSSSNSVYYYENSSILKYRHADSLLFDLKDLCWGGFAEDFWNFNLVLGSCKGKAPKLNHRGSSGSRHEGSTILMRDFDCNGQIDILLGDISFNKLVLGYNTGFTGAAKITKQDTNFPSYDVPADVNYFPGAYYIDADNDSTKNLVVAPNAVSQFANYNNIHSYKNVGTTQCPDFKLAQKDFLVNEMIEVGSNAFPLIIDIDGDSLNDILVGSFGVWTQSQVHESRFSYYKNTGTKANPKYDFITRDYLLLPQSQDTGLYPTIGDVDNDGDIDLYVGTDRGKILFFENKAASSGDSMKFVYTSTPFDSVNFGKSIRPYLFDVDNDGKLDLLVGSQQPYIKLYKNIGTKSKPNFDGTKAILDWGEISHFNQIGFGNMSIVIADLDSSGVPLDTVTDIKKQRKIFIGTSTGSMFLYTGLDSTGTNKVAVQDSTYHYTTDLALTLGDISGDDKLDFIIGQKSGGISVLLKDGGNIVPPPPVDTTDTNDTLDVIQERNSSNIIKVYPNPTSGIFTLEITGDHELVAPIVLRDLTGRVVLNGTNEANRTFNVSELPAGVYWLEISSDGKKMYQQIVKVDH